jgi:DNA modification methylase
MEIFDEHRYWWVLSMQYTASKFLPGKFIIVEQRPVLWYVKEFRRGRTMIADILRPTEPADRSEHEWAKSEAGVGVLIDNLTEPGELIIDPFAGTGYWGTLAANLGRRWIGADIKRGGSTKIVV